MTGRIRGASPDVQRAVDALLEAVEVQTAGWPGPSLQALQDCEEGPTLGVATVAALLDLSQDTVRELLVAGDIRAFRIGRHYKVLWRSFRDYLFRSGALPLRGSERLALPQARG